MLGWLQLDKGKKVVKKCRERQRTGKSKIKPGSNTEGWMDGNPQDDEAIIWCVCSMLGGRAVNGWASHMA